MFLDLTSEYLRDMRAAYSKQDLTSRVENAVGRAQRYVEAGKLVRAEKEIEKAYAALDWLKDLYGVEGPSEKELRESLNDLESWIQENPED